jgi:hypothetical protein
MWHPHTLARFSLALTALVFGGFGLTLLVFPTVLTGAGVALTTAEARAEIRAFYGGLELGLAHFFALAALRPGWFRPGLVAQAASLGGAALGRALGMIVDGAFTPMMLLLFAAEGAGSLLGLWALSRLRPR